MLQSKGTETASLDLKTGSNIIYIYILQTKDVFTKLNTAVATTNILLLKSKNQSDQPKDLLHRIRYLLARNNINKMNKSCNKNGKVMASKE